VAQNIRPTTYTVSNSCYPDQLASQYYGPTICNLASATFVGDNFADSSPRVIQDRGSNPSLSFISPQIDTEDFGSGGNIKLKPTKSDNKDATLGRPAG